MDFRHWKTKVSVLPLVPILRGITADRALSVAHILRQNGFYSLEIPMNSPDAVETISLCVRELGDEMVVGAAPSPELVRSRYYKRSGVTLSSVPIRTPR